MRATMMVDSFKLEAVKKYSDPDYNLTFFDNDGGEVILGIYERSFDELLERMIALSKEKSK